MIIAGAKPVDNLTDEEISLHLKQTQEGIASGFDSGDDISGLQARERDLIAERGRRGMEIERRGSYKRGVDQIARDFIDLIHDMDGSRRSSPLFKDPDLGRARDRIEEAVELVEKVLAGRD
jgi:hypothetical protein